MNKNLQKISLALTLFALPLFTYAASVDSLIIQIGTWLRLLLPIVTGIALLVFIWGIVIFIAKSGDETARAEGRQKMFWGIIALFVIIAVWGLVSFVSKTILGNDNPSGTTVTSPAIPQ